MKFSKSFKCLICAHLDDACNAKVETLAVPLPCRKLKSDKNSLPWLNLISGDIRASFQQRFVTLCLYFSGRLQLLLC